MPDKTINYPIRLDLPRYNRVPILRVGEYYPEGVQGVWKVTRELLERFSANYDPHFYPASINTDHERFWGPALGIISIVIVEGDTLYADLVNVDPLLAWQIDAGQWPHRSVEAWDTTVFDKPFYDNPDKADYITGLGLFGQRSPAVPDLGPFPPRETDEVEDLKPVVIAYPLAAHSIHGQCLRLTNEEVPMPKAPTATKALDPVAKPKEEKVEAAAQAEATEALQAENAELQAKVEELTAQVKTTTTDNVAQLQTSNQELKDQLSTLQSQLTAKAREDRMNALEAELIASGHVTPANRDKVRATLERAYDADHVLSAASAPAEGAQQASLLDDVVSTIKASKPLVPFGRITPSNTQQPAAALNTDEHDVCAALGLEEDEYRGLAAKNSTSSAEDVLSALAELIASKTGGGS